MKHKLVFAGLFIILTVLVILLAGRIFETKEINVTTEWVRDQKTNRISPLFSVYYSFAGSEQDPIWLIYNKEGRWWVVDMRKAALLYSEAKSKTDQESIIPEEELTLDWVRDRKYSPMPSNYEALIIALDQNTNRVRNMMRMLHLNPVFYLESQVFGDILDRTKDFDEGRLRPDNDIGTRQGLAKPPFNTPLNGRDEEACRIDPGQSVDSREDCREENET